jgi:hypothetical protein
MVQFCPKCGTQAPDDESAFCNKCGTRLPPVIPEKIDIVCPGCGTRYLDEQSVFCNKCGSPLQRIPPAQIRQDGARPAAALPVMKKERCPSCGAPFVDEISDYCNVCGANIHEPVPLTPARETDQPYQETPEPDTMIADNPDNREEVPVKAKSRGSLLKWGLVAIVTVIVLVVIAAFISGALPSGTNQSSATTPSPTINNQNSLTTLPTPATTMTTAPVLTTAPAIVPTTLVPTTVVTTNAVTTITTNVSTNITTNATPTVKPSLSATISSQPYSIGQSASDGKTKLTVNSITFKDKLSDPTPSYAIGKKYLIVEITYENLQQNVTATPDISGMMLKDGGGYSYDQANDVLLENPFYVYGKTVPPQEKKTGNMLFIVPPGATYLKFQYNFGANIATFQLT